MENHGDIAQAAGPWMIRGPRRALLAAVPPLVTGLGVAAATAVNAESWFDLTPLQQGLVLATTLLPAVALGVGGLIALCRSMPNWSYAWAASTLIAAAMLFKIAAEERAEVGLPVVSPAADVVIGAILVLAGGVVLVWAALRGWSQAGLTSIGFASIFGITTLSLLRAAPFYRDDLVRLAAPLGGLQALLIYIYVRRPERLIRWLVLAATWALSVIPMLLGHQVWQPWLAAQGRTLPLLPLLAIVTVLAWAGPVAGLAGRPVRRKLNRA